MIWRGILPLLGFLLLIGCASRQDSKVHVATAAELFPEDSVLRGAGSDADKAHGNFLHAMQLRMAGQPALAEVFYKRALAHAPGNRFLAFELVELLLTNGKQADALRLVRQALRFPGQADSDELLVAARVFRENQLPDSARVFFRQALNGSDSNPRALFEYAMLLEEANDYPELTRVFGLLLPQMGYPTQMVDKQAMLLRLQGQDSALVDLLQQAWQNHGEPSYGVQFAEILQEQGRLAEAEEVLRILATDSTTATRGRAALAQFYLRNGKGAEALPLLRILYTEDTTRLDVLQRAAMLEFDMGMTDSSKLHFAQLVERRPDDHISWFYLSSLAALAGDTTAAMEASRRALAIKPDALAYRNQMAALYYLRGRYPEAHAILDTALQQHPGHPLAHHFKSSALLHEAATMEEKGNGSDSVVRKVNELRTRAVGHLRLSLASDSIAVDVLFDLAANLERLGKPDSAEIWFRKLLAIKPQHGMALNYLGYMLADSNRELPRAGRLIDSALAIEPSNHAYLDSKAWWLHRTGNDSGALEILLFLDKQGMDDPVVFEHLATVLDALGRGPEAVVYWEKILLRQPHHPAARKRLGK